MSDISKIKLPDGVTYNVKDNTKLPISTAGGIASCSGEGSNWYYQIATIVITTTYMNRPVVFEISGRNKQFSRLQIQFTNSNTTDPYLQYFSSDGDNEFYIKKTTTSTWKVYGKYSEQWGLSRLHRITGAGADIGVTVVMTNIGTTLPSDTTQATYIGNVAYATSAGSVGYANSAGNASTVNNLTVQTAVPANAVFTDTKVTQTVENGSGISADYYSILLANTRTDSTETAGAKKTPRNDLGYSPTDHKIRITGANDNAGGLIVYSTNNNGVNIEPNAIRLFDTSYNDTITLTNTTGAITANSVSANSVTCNSMSVSDISSQYTFARTAGPWTYQGVRAVRSGNVVTMQIVIKGGTSVSAGSNGITGTFSGGPLPARVNNGSQDMGVCGVNFYGVSALVGTLNSSGNFTLRLLINNQSLGSNLTSIGFTFVCD